MYGRNRRDPSGDPSDDSDDEKRPGKRNRDRQSNSRKHRQKSSSKEKRRNRVQSMAKLKRYDGTTSVESFLSQFHACARYYNWGGENESLQLRYLLDGDATNLLREEADADYISYNTLARRLRERFELKFQEERYETELRTCRRGKEEKLSSLHANIFRLMALAYPGEDSPLRQKIARDYFLAALDDPHFETRIREREPSDLRTAYNTALRFEIQYEAAHAMELDDANNPSAEHSDTPRPGRTPKSSRQRIRRTVGDFADP